MQNINRVLLTGNLTRDPELKTTAGGTQICNMRIAVNSRIKREGEWEDKASYFDVTCFGAQAENCHKYLAKGRALAVDGRLDWREWTTQAGEKRQGVQIIADSVQFLQDGRAESESGSSAPAAPVSAAPADDVDDIPF